MTKPKVPNSNLLTTFDPRLRQLLEQGCARRMTINGDPNGDPKVELRKLMQLRVRLNQLRKALYDADIPGAKNLYACVVRLDTPALQLIVEPREAPLSNLLDQVAPAVAAPLPKPGRKPARGEAAQAPPLTIDVPLPESMAVASMLDELTDFVNTIDPLPPAEPPEPEEYDDPEFQPPMP